ncbi:MAG TPA: SRPBCC family protein [Candidatus Udaeobacter sp.]|nr:SRPBCC family protein [Candidatus Udaeobacter sp.]
MLEISRSEACGRRNLIAGAAIVFAMAVALCPPASADHRQVTMVSLHSEIDVAAPPAAVWTFITTGKNFATWCPSWSAARNSRIAITRVGDVLDYRDEWGNGGQSIVTYAVRNRELRVAHEPYKGDYVCQAKFRLTPDGRSTKLEFWDQYSDESPETDREATAAKMQSASDQSLAAIKQALETKAPATATQTPEKR